MTIQDAIEKAKQLRLSRAHESHSASVLPVADQYAPISRPVSVPARGYVRLDYPVAAIDVERCHANRIMLGGEGDSSNANAAAAYRMVRARVLQRSRSSNWSVLGVTSPGAGEGKSTTALNLALAIAREKNNNVFLVDLDMRNPSICHYLGVTPPRELIEYFESAARVEEVFFSVGFDGLAFAGSTRSTTEASEMLSTSKIEELIAHIRSICPAPLIIVDLPPVLSTDDALVVGPKLDATILVVAEGKTRRDALQQAVDLVSEFNLAGVILNRSSQMLSDYYAT